MPIEAITTEEGQNIRKNNLNHQPTATRDCPCGNHDMNHTIWDMVLQIGVNEVQTKPFLFAPHCVKNMSWPYFVMPAPLWCKSPKNTSLWYLHTIHSKFCNVPIFLHCSSKTIRQKNCSASSLKIQNSLFITFHRENQTVAYFLCSRWRGKENYKCRY